MRTLRDLVDGEKSLIEPERLKRGRIMAAEFGDQTPDIEGAIGYPLFALSTLELMERKGTITSPQRDAGEEFHRLFRLASLDGIRAAAMDRVSHAAAYANTSLSGNERARKRIARSIMALGGDGSILTSCAWHVLGLEWSLRQWSVRATGANVDRAAGVLVGSLAVLESHFGL